MTAGNRLQPRLVLLCGLPASGKTTLARELEDAYGAVRLNAGSVGSRRWTSIRSMRASSSRAGSGILGTHAAGRSPRANLGCPRTRTSWARSERDEKAGAALETLGVAVELRFLDAPSEELVRRVVARAPPAASPSPRITWSGIEASSSPRLTMSWPCMTPLYQNQTETLPTPERVGDWGGQRGSNPQPAVPQTAALPLSYGHRGRACGRRASQDERREYSGKAAGAAKDIAARVAAHDRVPPDGPAMPAHSRPHPTAPNRHSYPGPVRTARYLGACDRTFATADTPNPQPTVTTPPEYHRTTPEYAAA